MYTERIVFLFYQRQNW